MRIEVVSSVNEVQTDELTHKTAVVVDVLRATSTMATAIAFGSSEIIPVKTVSEARRRKAEADLLVGERSCKKISGFDYGNSPLEYRNEHIRGKKIMMTTTNGTRAIQKSNKATHILAGSLLNGAACANAALSLKRDIVIVCAGTQDSFSLEDGLGAGFLIEEIMRSMSERDRDEIIIDDFGKAMHSSFLHEQTRLQDTILHCQNGIRLSKLGFMEDVLYCSQTNILDIVPAFKEHRMVSFDEYISSK